MIVTQMRPRNSISLSAALCVFAVASAACSPATFAQVQSPFEIAREKACGAEMPPTPYTPQRAKYDKCVIEFLDGYAAQSLDKPSLACVPSKLAKIDGVSLASDFVMSLGGGKPKDGYALLSAEFKTKVKEADVASLIDVYFPEVKSGFSGKNRRGVGSRHGDWRICSGEVAVSHVVGEIGLEGGPYKLLAFEIVEENGEGRIRAIYAKTRSDVVSLDGVKPFETSVIDDALNRFAISVKENNTGSFLQVLSAEKRFAYDTPATVENTLTPLFAPYKGKIKGALPSLFGLEPRYSLKPTAPRMENGYPVVDAEGTIDTPPSVTAFKLKFVYDIGRWWVHEFKFDVKP